MRILGVLLLLLVATPAFANDLCWPSSTTSFTINSAPSTTPGPNGIDVRGYDQHLTLNFIKVSGTVSTDVQVKLAGGDWVTVVGGPLTSNFFGGVNSTGMSTIQFVRLNTGTCTACTATAQLCSRSNDH